MANMINSIEEHPVYLFDHSTSIEVTNIDIMHTIQPRCVALDPFTERIYVLITSCNFGYWTTVKIYSQSGEFLRSFIYKLEYTEGLAVHNNSIYIVSGLSCFLHFKVADFICLVGRKNAKGSGIGNFKQPRQLDISKEGDLFIADFGNNRVQILDGNLHYKRHISHHSMLKPCDVKLTPDEVYVSGVSPEQSTYCIHIFTYLGKKLRSIILNGIPKSMLWSGFCVDTRGNAAIIDDATSQIKFFTKEGNLIETMDTLNKGWIFGKPKDIFGVTWTTNQKLIILSKHYRTSLEIYSYN